MRRCLLLLLSLRLLLLWRLLQSLLLGNLRLLRSLLWLLLLLLLRGRRLLRDSQGLLRWRLLDLPWLRLALRRVALTLLGISTVGRISLTLSSLWRLRSVSILRGISRLLLSLLLLLRRISAARRHPLGLRRRSEVLRSGHVGRGSGTLSGWWCCLLLSRLILSRGLLLLLLLRWRLHYLRRGHVGRSPLLLVLLRPLPLAAGVRHRLQDMSVVAGLRGRGGGGRRGGTRALALLLLLAEALELLLHHLGVLVLVDHLRAVLLELPAELVARVEELPLLLVVLLLDLRELRLQLLLVHGERLHLALEHLHPGRGHHGAHVRHHRLGEDLVDEPVVAAESGVGHVLDAESVVDVVLVLGRLDVDPPLRALGAPRLGVLDDGAAAGLGLDVGLVGGGVLVHRHGPVVLSLKFRDIKM